MTIGHLLHMVGAL